MKRIHKSNFSLIELLVVVGIMALLSGMIFMAVPAIKKKSRDNASKAMMMSLVDALEQYYSEWGFYPDSLGSSNRISKTSLETLKSQNGENYIQADSGDMRYVSGVLVDYHSDDNYFYYESPGVINTEGFDIWSAGADGNSEGNTLGTNDDIKSWDRNY